MTHYNIKATREGLISHLTSSGYTIDIHVPFVALPDVGALYRAVRITNQANKKSCVALVLDVGPWNEHDCQYVDGGARPGAESGNDERGRITNHAGIDLGEYVWRELEMKDNGLVTWSFLA